MGLDSLDVANKMLKQAVEIYNNERRHCWLQMQTPSFPHTHQQHQYKEYKKKKSKRSKEPIKVR